MAWWKANLGWLCWIDFGLFILYFLVVLSYPFVKEFSKYSFTESKLWNLTDSLCSDRPEYYLKLREFVFLDDFKLAMKSAGKNTISNISNDSEQDSEQLELSLSQWK